MAHDDKSFDAIFCCAIEVAGKEERTAYITRACGPDEALRLRVERLVVAHFQAGSFLELPPEPPTIAMAMDPPAEGAGTTIGPYKLLQQIGEGGMGTVYMAEQTRPVRRLVALKVTKPGMGSRQIIARFEAERQALALMDHANIARVLDADATECGRPYFVMELVHGVPITRYCDENGLTPRQRLELFVPVCRAIQHAHQKGIIHRDIKPSNVMITHHDGKPVPKVIDFGVAKATEQRLTEKTMFTQYGTLVGTLEYMSPEQAEMSAQGVDTRSDIYSLGVLLYELLTGTTPLCRDRVRDATYAEILRMIKEEEPPCPSTRLSDSCEARASISARRQMEPAKLAKLVRGELDWIVMKSLEKDRNRRYESASSFAADIERYLNDEPVQACPPSSWYLFRKVARRHRGASATASALVLVVLMGVITLAASNVVIRQEQARTKGEKDRAQKARALAQDRADEIQRGLEALKAANAMLDRGREYFYDRRWDDSQSSYTEAIRLRPDLAPAWLERGELYAHLGLWDLAAADIARDVELREPVAALRWYQHALLRLVAGDTEGYRQACRQMRGRFHGTIKVKFLEEMLRSIVLAPGADTDLRPIVEMGEKIVVHHHWSSYSLYILGTAHYRAGQHEQAIRRLRESLAVTDWKIRLLSHPVLAMAYHKLGRAAEARESLDEAARVLDRWTQERYALAEKSWVIHRGVDAAWPISWWDWLECRYYHREATLLIDGTPPPDDARLHMLRARSLASLRWSTKARVEYAEALKLWPHDPQVRLESHRNRAFCHVDGREWTEAAVEFARASELRTDDSHLWRYQAEAHFAAGDVVAYRQTCKAMLEHFERTDEETPAANALMVCVLGADALPDLTRLLPLVRVSDRNWYWGDWVRGAFLYRVGKFDEAVQCFEKAAEFYRLAAWDWCFLAMAHHRLGHAEEAGRCLSKARRWIDEANSGLVQPDLRGIDDPTGTRPTWGAWHEPVVIPLLLREAEQLTKNRP